MLKEAKTANWQGDYDAANYRRRAEDVGKERRKILSGVGSTIERNLPKLDALAREQRTLFGLAKANTGTGRMSLISGRKHDATPITTLTGTKFEALRQRQKNEPVRVSTLKLKLEVWWWFRDKLFIADNIALRAGDLKGLVLERENTSRLRLQRAHALIAMAEQRDKTRVVSRFPKM